MMVFQGLRHPAPFSDDLEPVDKPYKRVSMDEAKQGTSREWDFHDYESDSPAWLHINETTEMGKISRRLTTPLCLSFVSDSADSKRRYLYYSPLVLVLLCLPAHTVESCRKRLMIKKKLIYTAFYRL